MNEARDLVARIQAQWARERPDVDVTPTAVIGRLTRLSSHVSAQLAAQLRRHGLGEGEFDVLAALRRSGAPFELAPGEIAQHTMVTTGAVTKRIDRLEADGLVSRRTATHDKRSRVVALSEAGRRVIDTAFTEHMRAEQRLLSVLAEEDIARLEVILRRWLAALDA